MLASAGRIESTPESAYGLARMGAALDGCASPVHGRREGLTRRWRWVGARPSPAATSDLARRRCPRSSLPCSRQRLGSSTHHARCLACRRRKRVGEDGRCGSHSAWTCVKRYSLDVAAILSLSSAPSLLRGHAIGSPNGPLRVPILLPLVSSARFFFLLHGQKLGSLVALVPGIFFFRISADA